MPGLFQRHHGHAGLGVCHRNIKVHVDLSKGESFIVSGLDIETEEPGKSRLQCSD